ncbi:ABC transporter permease [Caloramator sp. E03]|uniref:ABC transporter permease n=1 Tax=Caloramator sp. E03 TaxID=2576307 RepID=UPI001110CFB9|nr:ABC transporter permease [Caloramator sp. E03]QCX33315.1 ABC transporter permease [Caloramator sp. E03]
MKKKFSAFLILSPVLVWMFAFFLIPLFLVVSVSFLTRGQYGGIQFNITLDNYIRLIDPMYLKIFWNSLVISLMTTISCLLLGYPFAYIIGRSPKKFRAILLMLIILPFWTNSLVRTYAWIILLRTEGVLNSYLMMMGIINKPLQLLYNNGAVLVGMLYIMFPFMVLPIYASVEKLDNTLIEAAKDLYASPIKTFLKITLPLTKSGIFAGCLLVFVPTLGLFFIPDLMGGSKIILLSNLIKNQFLAARDWPFGMAISVLLIMLMLIIIGIMRLKGEKIDSEVF